MKRITKNIAGIVLCLGLLQPSIQASPFKEFARKWAARGATVGYWSVLSYPGVQALESEIKRERQQWKDINGSDIHNQPFFTELKEYAPEKYAAINALYKRDGLSSLDNYSVKVLTRTDYERFDQDPSPSRETKYFVSGAYNQAYCIGKNRLVIANSLLEQTTRDQIIGRMYVDSEGEVVLPKKTIVVEAPSIEVTAGFLAHEREHSEKNHNEKRAALNTVMPFALYGLSKGVASIVSKPKVRALPSITRSLLRIPQAVGLVGVSAFINLWYSRVSEREADAAMRNSPQLAHNVASYMEKHECVEQEKQLEESFKQAWAHCNAQDFNDSKVEKFVAQNMSEAEFVAFFKKINRMFLSHPYPLERVEYLRKWAAEAKAKSESAK